MRTNTVTVSSKGQVVLPKEVRERLGVNKGDAIEFVLGEHGIHVRLKPDDDNPFLAWIGNAALGAPGEAQWAQDTRHAGLDAADLAALRAGPGARVVHLPRGEAQPRVEPAGDAAIMVRVEENEGLPAPDDLARRLAAALVSWSHRTSTATPTVRRLLDVARPADATAEVWSTLNDTFTHLQALRVLTAAQRRADIHILVEARIDPTEAEAAQP